MGTATEGSGELLRLTDDEAFALLYRIICFLVSLYLVGDVLCQRIFKIVPPLVGQILVGLVFGPDGQNWLVTDAAHLLLSTAGQLGLVLMLCQAGSQMDLELLQKTGLRSVIMAVTGSLLPTAIGFTLAYTIVLEDDHRDYKSALAVGASFGPTSAGIALVVLEQCHVLATTVGQLVVAVAIVDDILALVVLSQLRALTRTNDVSIGPIVVPIVSALAWLILGSVIAIWAMPKVWNVLEDYVSRRGDENNKEKGEPKKLVEKVVALSNGGAPQDMVEASPKDKYDVEMTMAKGEDAAAPGSSNNVQAGSSASELAPATSKGVVYYATALNLLLLPATYYSEASFFLGAFLAGLFLATQKEAAVELATSWDALTQWLMRLFFGCTIAFAIPVRLWWQEPETLAHGCLLALALLGKVAVGPLLTPVLAGGNGGRKWDAHHWRDSMIVGCSMAGEAEFAFVVAAFGLEQGLIPETVYASVTFAILLSTVVSPILLRITLATATTATTTTRD